MSENFGQTVKYGLSSTTLSVNVSNRNVSPTPPTYREFQMKHIWTLCGLVLELKLSWSFQTKISKLYKTWPGRLVNMSQSWESTWIECRAPVKVCEPNSPAFPSSDPKTDICRRCDAIGHRLWAALALKVANIRIEFRCMLMLGLGPT